jgi:transcriptional regulator with PAS, ATPase and Fis domain
MELAQVFLDRHRHMRPLSLSPAARDALLAYGWPGNVRELERVIERAVALAGSDQISLDDLPPTLVGHYADSLGTSTTCSETMRAWGSRYARLVLERCDNNKRRACKALGISYHTLQAYLRYRPPASSAGSARRRPLRALVTDKPDTDSSRSGEGREGVVS